jgi:hypothetical protein
VLGCGVQTKAESVLPTEALPLFARELEHLLASCEFAVGEKKKISIQLNY